jgi:hypothetical protein
MYMIKINPVVSNSAHALFLIKYHKLPITSCAQNDPFPPKQFEEEPQYRDGQYFLSIGSNIKICGKGKQRK